MHGRVSLFGLAALLTARIAHADASAEAPVAAPAERSSTTWEVAGIASYLTPPIRGAANPFGAGFGGRFGVSFGHLYLGATAVDFLGGQDVDLTTHAIVYGGEVGYQLQRPLGSMALTFRPMVGLGGMSVMYSTPATSSSSSSSSRQVDVVSNASGGSSTNTTSVFALYVQPGATLVLSGSWAFVALKGSALFSPSVSDGLGGSEAWFVYGLDGELGIRW